MSLILELKNLKEGPSYNKEGWVKLLVDTFTELVENDPRDSQYNERYDFCLIIEADKEKWDYTTGDFRKQLFHTFVCAPGGYENKGKYKTAFIRNNETENHINGYVSLDEAINRVVSQQAWLSGNALISMKSVKARLNEPTGISLKGIEEMDITEKAKRLI